jgi:hypothetical protein
MTFWKNEWKMAVQRVLRVGLVSIVGIGTVLNLMRKGLVPQIPPKAIGI